MTDGDDELEGRIAVIGMAGRFPGAATLDEFWTNLRQGTESIRALDEDELLAAGESRSSILDPAYVRAAAPLADIDQFDAAFFGMSPRDAAVFDPQHRLFLECAWEAFEHAGYVGERVDGAVGVFASCGLSEYMFKNVLANHHVAQSVGEWLIRHTGNDTNFLATRASYEMDLHGPSLNVQTACSSTLVAVHLACQSLLSGECDMALAGGAVVAPVQARGYVYKEGEILSPDGHCRAFDARSAGTVISSACGAVLLKPLAAALADGDHVLAAIRGSAINNDGRAKVGYLAPSVTGQARVVTEALAVAGVDARDVSYVETHGTGTLIGDPIEMAGLTQAYRESTDDTGFCAIGSLKTNIGHTGEASGVAALIKTVLSLVHRQIPASLHYEVPNPQIDFPRTPFFVNAALRPWEPGAGGTRIAGITGLGAGGTNAHLVVEEAPAPEPSGTSRPAQLLTVAARTPAALERAVADLAAHLRATPDAHLADVAYTRLAGRKGFRVRRAVVATSATDAADALESADPRRGVTQQGRADAPSVVFMMPGGGAQYPGMGQQLYDTEPVYRDALDACCRVVNPRLGFDLREVMFPAGGLDEAGRRLERPSVALPALFATEYAMVALLASWGVTPAAMIGHSAGEYAVACVAGVLTMRDAIELVALRGRLFEQLPPGGMLSVALSEDEIAKVMPPGLTIAAVNAPGLCVVAGPVGRLAELEATLEQREIECLRVRIDVAAHSEMLEPILVEFGAYCRTIAFGAPRIPYVSNLTGTWVTEADVTDPTYWVRHLRRAVRFGDGIETILTDADRVLLEIGPGRTLASLAAMGTRPAVAVAPTMRHPKEDAGDLAFVLGALGRAWAAGVDLDPRRLWAGEQRRRVPLPTYPFERQRYWVEPDKGSLPAPATAGLLRKQPDVADWFSTPTWRRSLVPSGQVASAAPLTWLVVHDGDARAAEVMGSLAERGHRVVAARFGRRFAATGPDRYEVDPSQAEDWTGLVDHMVATGGLPDRVVHLTAVGPPARRRIRAVDELRAFDTTVERDYASVIFLARALSAQARPLRLSVVTSGVHAERDAVPARALLHGAARVIPRELGHVTTIAIDLDDGDRRGRRATPTARLLDELEADATDDLVVYRRGERWVRAFEALPLPPASASPWTPGGVYVVTGGLGGIGLSVAAHIARTTAGVRLVLVGRTPLPPESTWDDDAGDRATDAATHRRIAAIRAMRAQGATVDAIAADVTDLEAMRTAIDGVRARHGRITGVVHSAGILRDALIALRTPNAFSPVIDTKARGLLVLDELLAKQPPELLVLFSSVSSIIGLPGQVDYTAANAFLDAFATARNRQGATRAVVVNWSAWQEVGMAVDAIEASRVRHEGDQTPASAVQLLERRDEEADEATFSTAFSRRRHWLLAEHVVRGGDALIPGTGYLEIVRDALVAGLDAPRPVELTDVFFLSPFQVGAGEVRTLRVKLTRSTGAVVMFSDAEASPHATATVTIVDPDRAPHHDLAAIRARCGARIERFDGYSDQRFMEFGARWGSLRSVAYGLGEALVTTDMPPAFVDEIDALWLHPALLDMATGSAQALIAGFSADETFYVPFSYGRVLVRGPLPARAVSHVRLRPGAAADVAVFDVAICDTTGQEIVTVEAFTMRRIPAGAALAAPRPAVAQLAEPAGAESPIEAARREGILPDEGVDALDRILAADVGAQVVASSIDVRQWAARVDADAIVPDEDAEGGDRAAGVPQYERPNISAPYVEPRTPIELELAGMWRELLGVERVGRDDDFFELGGQSLIAVRLFTRMRKKYSVDLALSTLFEAPTIAQCAAIVAGKAGIVDAPIDEGDAGVGVEGDVHGDTDGDSEATGGDPAVGHGAQAAPPVPVPPVPVPAVPAPVVIGAFRALVTIQKGVPGRTPFFCVHGAGGNVLNFRDLSVAMGRSQPFYALQARGTDGVLRPHDSIEAMAEAYLTEIVATQLHGPYVLGGYSGGGLVAFEMAHRLRAMGEDVALVVLLDTFPPTVPQRGITMRMRVTRLREDGFSYLTYMVTRRIDAARRRRSLARVADLVARGETVPSELRNMHLDTNFTEAAHRYVLRPWSGRVILLRAETLHAIYRALDESYGWGKVVTDGFELVQVPGDHDTLVLEPNATKVAAALRDALDSVVPADEPAMEDSWA